MKVIILAFFYSFLVGATTSNIQPHEDSSIGDDTGTPSLEEINPSPNPVPAENESDDFRGSTIQKEEDVKQTNKRVKVPQKPLKAEENGKYRKGL